MSTGASSGTARPAVWPLSFAIESMGATCLGPTGSRAVDPSALRFAGASVDSRVVVAGGLFFGLPGERVDGFDYAGAAMAAGAAAVVVAAGRGRPSGCDAGFVLTVDDPVAALGRLAQAVRARFRGRVVGVTGSNGKTTTKELVAAALGPFGAVLRTPGNLNTEIGLPLVVLSATGHEDYWVLEMAMRGPGEIRYLAQRTMPHVAVVTNIAAAHVGRLGSLAAVAAAKGEIFADLGRDGRAVIPADEPLLLPHVAHLAPSAIVRFAGIGGPTAGPSPVVRVLDALPCGADGMSARIAVDRTPLLVRIPLAGEHNVINAASALAVVHALGLPLGPAAAALADVRLPAHRSHPVDVAGRVILDDCYNANPASMRAALATVKGATRARAFAILGDMLELGDESEQAHRALGADVAKTGIAGLAVVGDLGRHIAEGARASGMPADRVFVHVDPAAAAADLVPLTRPGDWILVKASRGARLERAVAALQALWKAA